MQQQFLDCVNIYVDTITAVSKFMPFLAAKHLLAKCNVCCFYFVLEKTISPCPDCFKIIWHTKVKKIWVMIMVHSVLADLPWKMKSLFVRFYSIKTKIIDILK